MVMNPLTHPRGSPPDFELPAPNPNPSRITDALWWLVRMRLALQPGSQNGGTFAGKAGYHNAGENLPDFGLGNSRTDHSIRRAPDRAGPWWKKYTSAHDWTFPNAHSGDYSTITKYTKRLINSMRDPNDLRPDDVYAYTLGQANGDTLVEGYNEYTNMPETSSDKTHLFHRHDSFRRNIIGSFPHMWKALTIDMGWTYAEWLESTKEVSVAIAPEDIVKIWTHDLQNGEGVDEAYRVLNRAADNSVEILNVVKTLATTLTQHTDALTKLQEESVQLDSDLQFLTDKTDVAIEKINEVIELIQSGNGNTDVVAVLNGVRELLNASVIRVETPTPSTPPTPTGFISL